MSDTYQLLPPLTDDEYAALKDSIAEHGVFVPIVFDDQGNLIDGHHRKRACDELGITDYPRESKLFENEAPNMNHLPGEPGPSSPEPVPKQAMVTQIKEQHSDWSVRKISAMTGIPKSSVDRYLNPPDSETVPDDAEPELAEASPVPDGTAAWTASPNGAVRPELRSPRQRSLSLSQMGQRSTSPTMT